MLEKYITELMKHPLANNEEWVKGWTCALMMVLKYTDEKNRKKEKKGE